MLLTVSFILWVFCTQVRLISTPGSDPHNANSTFWGSTVTIIASNPKLLGKFICVFVIPLPTSACSDSESASPSSATRDLVPKPGSFLHWCISRLTSTPRSYALPSHRGPSLPSPHHACSSSFFLWWLLQSHHRCHTTSWHLAHHPLLLGLWPRPCLGNPHSW